MLGPYSDKRRNEAAKTYLRLIHDALDDKAKLDMHTFFYFDNFDYCPICEHRLFMTEFNDK